MIHIQPDKKIFHLFLPMCMAVLLVISLVNIRQLEKNAFTGSLEASASIITEEPAFVAEMEPPAKESFPQVPDGVRSRAALAVHVAGGLSGRILLENNKDVRLPVASLTKLMTAWVALDRYNVSQKTLISAAAMAQVGEQGSLKEGEALSVRNLLFISLIESSNRAAYALAEIMGVENFVAAMNEKASALGMANTHFADSTGLSNDSYSTAQDIAMLSQHLFENYPLFKEIIRYRTYSLYVDGIFHHTLENTNKMLGEHGVVGGKTGWTNEARGCFMAIQEHGRDNYTLSVILGAEDRFLEMEKLITINQ